jgi:hypothetical protein
LHLGRLELPLESLDLELGGPHGFLHFLPVRTQGRGGEIFEEDRQTQTRWIYLFSRPRGISFAISRGSDDAPKRARPGRQYQLRRPMRAGDSVARAWMPKHLLAPAMRLWGADESLQGSYLPRTAASSSWFRSLATVSFASIRSCLGTRSSAAPRDPMVQDQSPPEESCGG